MSFKNLYDILKIEDFADIDKVKKAFRLLAKSKHPDVGTNSSVHGFIEIKEAYKVLSKPESKALYDEQLKSKIYPRQSASTISRIDKAWIKQYKADQGKKRNALKSGNAEKPEIDSQIKFKQHLWLMLLSLVITLFLMWIITL